MDSSFGFIIFPSPASPSGGGAVTFNCHNLTYLSLQNLYHYRIYQ